MGKFPIAELLRLGHIVVIQAREPDERGRLPRLTPFTNEDWHPLRSGAALLVKLPRTFPRIPSVRTLDR